MKTTPLAAVLALAFFAGCASSPPAGQPAPGYAPAPPPVIFSPPVLPEPEDKGIVETENVTTALGVA